MLLNFTNLNKRIEKLEKENKIFKSRIAEIVTDIQTLKIMPKKEISKEIIKNDSINASTETDKKSNKKSRYS